MELTNTEFQLSPGRQPQIAWRGKHHRENIGSFQWGTGTQALCFVFLKYLIATRAMHPSNFCLASRNSDTEGGAHPITPVTSLDNLLSKRVDWIRDMFGCYDDSPVASRLFSRNNSGGKMRSREIQFSIMHTLLPPKNIQIFWKRREGKEQLAEGAALDELCSKIEKQWAKKKNYQPSNLTVKQIPSPSLTITGAKESGQTGVQTRSDNAREPNETSVGAGTPYKHIQIIHQYVINDTKGKWTTVLTAELVEVLLRQVPSGGSFWGTLPQELETRYKHFKKKEKWDDLWKDSILADNRIINAVKSPFEWDTFYQPPLLRGEKVWFLNSFRLENEFVTSICRDAFHAMQAIESFTWKIKFPSTRPAKRWWVTVDFHDHFPSNATLIAHKKSTSQIEWNTSDMPKGSIYFINWEW